MDPTPSLVSDFWTFMTGHFQTQVIDKANAPEMQVVASLLAALGLVDRATFLKDYATTIGHHIYLPFTVGTPGAANGWGLWSQIIVSAHEHQHVVEYEALGPIAYDYRYITDTPSRARFEAEAYRASLELNWWRTKTMPSPASLAALLHGYGCTDTDVAMAKTVLDASADAIRHGAVLNQASAVAIGWLNANAPLLRA